VSFDLEIRTTDKEKRANKWFEDIASAIVFTFADESVKYSVSRGSVKGRYVVSMSP
jgi:hypothetical protein